MSTLTRSKHSGNLTDEDATISLAMPAISPQHLVHNSSPGNSSALFSGSCSVISNGTNNNIKGSVPHTKSHYSEDQSKYPPEYQGLDRPDPDSRPGPGPAAATSYESGTSETGKGEAATHENFLTISRKTKSNTSCRMNSCSSKTGKETKPNSKESNTRASSLKRLAASASSLDSTSGGARRSDSYEKYWSRLSTLTASECEATEVALAYNCAAVRHHKGSRGWASIMMGGTLAMYDTKEEAIKRAVCAAMVMADHNAPPPMSLQNHNQNNNQSSKSGIHSSISKRTMSIGIPDNLLISRSMVSLKTGENADGVSAGSILSKGASPSNTLSSIKAVRAAMRKMKQAPLKSDIDTISAAKRRKLNLSHARESIGRPKACEMSSPETGQVLEVFRSCSQAERATKISRATIGKVCREGGGIIDGFFFQFVYLDPKSPQDKELKKIDTKERDLSLDDSLVSRTQNKPGHAEQHDIRSSAIDDSVPDVGWDESVVSSGYILNEEKLGNPPSTKISAGRCPRHCFDVTQLPPLRSTASKKKKLVELKCKGSGEIVVCFRGNSDAAFALRLDRTTVARMCEAQKEGSEEPDLVFPTFELRHASNRSGPSAYEYGIHEEDHYDIRESYSDRLARWKATFEKEKMQRKHTANLLKTPIQPPPSYPNSLPARKEVPVSILGGSTSMHALTPIILRNQNQLLNQDHQGICIVCQENKAQIVFEPCQHCLLCLKCSHLGHCQKFCPACRTSIISASRPSMVKLIRSRIYSAYSFM